MKAGRRSRSCATLAGGFCVGGDVAGGRNHDLHVHGLAVGRDRSRRRLSRRRAATRSWSPRASGRRCRRRSTATSPATSSRISRRPSTTLVKQGKVVPGSVGAVRARRRRRRHQEGRAEARHRHRRGLQADDAEGEIDRLFQERQRPDRRARIPAARHLRSGQGQGPLSRRHPGRGVRRQGRGRDRHAAVATPSCRSPAPNMPVRCRAICRNISISPSAC